MTTFDRTPPVAYEIAVRTSADELAALLEREARWAAQGPCPEAPTNEAVAGARVEIALSALALLESGETRAQESDLVFELLYTPGLLVDDFRRRVLAGAKLAQRHVQSAQGIAQPRLDARAERRERLGRVVALDRVRRALRRLGLIRQVGHDSSSVGAAGTGMPAASEHDAGPRRTGSEPTEEAHTTSREATA